MVHIRLRPSTLNRGCPRSLPEGWGSYVNDRELRTDLSENIAVSQSLSCSTRPRSMRACRRYLPVGAVGATVVAVLTTLSAIASSASTSGTPSPMGPTVACSTAIAPAPVLNHVEKHFASGLLTPFGVAFGPDGKHTFVDSLINPSTPPSGLTPMRDAGGISEYSVSASGLVSERVGSFPDGSLLGMAISPNGRDLVAAGGSGASVFSVPRIEQPNSAPSTWLLGSFTSRGQGAIEVAVSPDGDDVFVSLENSDQLAVFNLKKAESSGFGSADLVGYVPTGVAPVGMAISPNGRYLVRDQRSLHTDRDRRNAHDHRSAPSRRATLSLGRVHGLGRVQYGTSGGHQVLRLRDGPGERRAPRVLRL